MYSKEEVEKIEELRTRVKGDLISEEHYLDDFLIRWLRARSMNMEKAEEMLRNSLKWRKDIGVDRILETVTVPDTAKKIYMFGRFGEDKEGYPIIIVPGGLHSPHHRGSLEEYGKETLLKWSVYWMERVMGIMEEAREKSGKSIFLYHEILDMDGYAYKSFMHKPSVDYIIEMQKLFDDNYPEVLKSVMIINAPKIFSLLFAVIKPLLPKDTLEKITIFGTDEKEWIEAMKQKGFPMEKIPPKWGGMLNGTDEFCSQETSCWPDGPIPLKHFKEVPEADEEGYFTVKVGARDKLELKFSTPSENNNEGATASWKFKTDGKDIGFQLTFIQNDSKEEVIIPMKRVESDKSIQEGSSTKHGKGTFIFLFDNSFSFLKSKTLKYQISLT